MKKHDFGFKFSSGIRNTVLRKSQCSLAFRNRKTLQKDYHIATTLPGKRFLLH